VPFWRADRDGDDTRLSPGQTVTDVYEFPTEAKTVQVRVLYRRFWDEVARDKGWPDRDVRIIERRAEVP
jgi:hypothetical protein